MDISNKLTLIKKLYIDKEYYNYFYNPFYHSKKMNIKTLKQKWKNLYMRDPNHLTHFYINTPFCVDKCKFCQCSGKSMDAETMKNYIDYLHNYILEFNDILKDVEFSGLFFGGGTASIYSEKELDRLLNIIFSNIKFNGTYFKEFELNPMSTTFKKLDILSKYGIGRISFGVQSFNKEALDIEGRIYCPPERFKELIKYSRSIGINDINTDLLVGLNIETKEDCYNSLKHLMDCKPSTITIYTLQLNKKKSSLYTSEENYYIKIKEIHEFLIENLVKDSDFEIDSYNVDSVVVLSLKGTDPYWKGRYKEHQPKIESIFGIGFGSYSQIFGEGKYYITYDNYNVDSINVDFEKLSEEDEINVILIRFIQNGEIDTKYFKDNLGFDFNLKFKDIIQFLENNKKIRVEENKIFFTTANIEETYIYGLLFLDLKFILHHSLYIKLAGIRNNSN